MNRFSVIALVATVPMLLGCETATTDPASPSFGAAGGPQIASGSGHVPAAGGLRNLTFHAIKKPNGTVTGSYRINLTGLGLFFEVDVTCMTIEDNTAWIAGIISDTDAGFIEVGTVSYFFAIDNGEGSQAPADVVSTARINDIDGEDLLFCQDKPLLLPSFPIQMGNVQIR